MLTLKDLNKIKIKYKLEWNEKELMYILGLLTNLFEIIRYDNYYYSTWDLANIVLIRYNDALQSDHFELFLSEFS